MLHNYPELYPLDKDLFDELVSYVAKLSMRESNVNILSVSLIFEL